MTKTKSGGGIGSRVNVSPPVRAGSPTVHDRGSQGHHGSGEG
jgi:hypothetical protein